MNIEITQPEIEIEAHNLDCKIDAIKAEIAEEYYDDDKLELLIEYAMKLGEAYAQRDFNKKLEGCVVVSEWIPTSESLPEEGVEVLVHRYGQVIQATKDSEYSGGFKERNCYGWQATYAVTHWMPKNFKLPEHCSYYYNDEHPYKETMVEAARGGNHE